MGVIYSLESLLAATHRVIYDLRNGVIYSSMQMLSEDTCCIWPEKLGDIQRVI